jgi:hypothetical protein
MKKLTCVFLVAVALLLTIPLPSYAGGTKVYFGVHFGPGYYPRAGFRHPGWWGPRLYWGGPVVVEPNYYSAPPVVIQQAPPVYAQPEQPQPESYWYYCQNPQGYYPYVKNCPGGWMKVIPSPAPSNP